MTLGERITYYRKRKGLSQLGLAQQARIPQTTLHGYESGYRRAENMSVTVAWRLAEVLGISLDRLADPAERVSGVFPPVAATQTAQGVPERYDLRTEVKAVLG